MDSSDSTPKRPKLHFDAFELVMGSLIALLLIAMFVVVWAISLALQPRLPSAFAGDILTIMESCAQSNTSSSGIIVGSQVINNKHTNADGLLRCLYASGVMVTLNGDPVLMRTQTP